MQSRFTELREKHHLEETRCARKLSKFGSSLKSFFLNPPLPAHDPDLPALEQRTNTQVSEFSKKTATFATLYAVDNF